MRTDGRDVVLPLAYLGVVLALVIALLPTALRPPQPPPPSTGAFSPDEPPEDRQETLITTIGRATSGTAGAGDAASGAAGAIEPPAQERLPPRGRCFGVPPRQTESAYSPPCRPAFSGGNGGATYKNVTGGEVRVGYWHILGMPRERGVISDVPPGGESAEHRTARVLQGYFNTRYELYGRRLRLVATPNDSNGIPEQRASAAQSADQEHVFAAVHLFDPYCDELARLRLVCFNGNPSSGPQYLKREPFFWSYQMANTQTDRIAAEYACKRLLGRAAAFAGGAERGRQRRIGVIVESSADNGFRRSANLARELREQCGYEAAAIADLDSANDASSLAATIPRMRAAEVTTIILEASLGPAYTMMSQSDASAYFPEWVMFNSYGLDFNDSARLLPPTQTAQMFGMSGWELPRPFVQTDCYRAYKSVDPDNEPNANFCNLLWISIEHIVNGIQEAGPNLDPETFRRGMFGMPLRPGREAWAIAGGYGPGDYSFVDTLIEMWWDQSASDPNGGERGAFRFTFGGRRWGAGELTADLRVFQEGVTGSE